MNSPRLVHRRHAAGFRVPALSAMVLSVLALGVLAALATPARGAFYFHSPSGNIGCGISRNGARCDIREHSWRPPPKPRSCREDWGYGLTVGKRHNGSFFCGGDTVLGLGHSLAYGRAVIRGRFKCTSRSDGVRCVNMRSRHGFKLSREHPNRF